MKIIYPICTFLQRSTLRLFADFKVEGTENVPPMGPLIVVCNHQSNVDPPIVSTFIPRRTWFLAKDGLFENRIVNWFLRSWGAFPLNREGADMQALRWVLNQLNHDQVVVIFPEGTRNPGAMKKALPGIARLALKTQAPILPVGMTGTETLEQAYRVWYPNRKIRVNIGQVFSLPVIEGKPNKEVLESLSDMIMGRVAALLPESYQGVYKTGRSSGYTASDTPDRH